MEPSEMHPNWRALASVYFPYKVFVTEGSSTLVPENKIQHQINNISGREAKRFYETTVKTSSTLAEEHRKAVRRKDRPKVQKVDFDRNKFFRAAVANDVRTLERFNYKDGDVDAVDDFGWTALMMAACEGAKESFSYLLGLGADLNICDRKGNSAYSLAKMKGFGEVLKLISNAGKSYETETQKTVSKHEPFFCKICQRKFEETNVKNHETSTVHRFNMKRPRQIRKRFNISEGNRGLKLMVKQGWDRNSGLGPRNAGQLYPIKTVIRKDRTGLGIKQSEPKVTHFKAYDLAAVKYKPPPHVKTRRELRRDQCRDKWKEQVLRRELN